MRYLELLWEPIDSRELPVRWDWAYVLQGEGLGELLAEQESIKCDYVIVNLDDWLCSEGLNGEDCWVWIVLEQADDLVLEEPGLVWECKHGEVFGLVDFKLHGLRVKNERRLLSSASLLDWQCGLECESCLDFVFAIIGDLESAGVDLPHGLIAVSELWILLDQKRTEVKCVLAHNECFCEETLWLLRWPRLLVGHVDVPVELVDGRELAECVQAQVEGLERANDLELQDLSEGADPLREELDVDLLGLLGPKHPSRLVLRHWRQGVFLFLGSFFSWRLSILCRCWPCLLW